MSLTDKIDRIVADFTALTDWEDRYKLIIALAKTLPDMPEALKTDDKKVRGCSSTVWLHADRDGDRVTYQADSDAVLVRGLIALLVQVYSGERAEDILATPPTFVERIGLNTNLSPNRANGVTAMVTQIRRLALDALMLHKKTRPTEFTPKASRALPIAPVLVHELIPARRPPRIGGHHALVLHGLGDSMAGWKPAVPLLGLDEVGWIFANAPKEYGPYGGYSWFDVLPDMTPDLAGVAASRAALDGLISHLLTDLKIPSERLFLLGFSQGCLMSLEVGLKSDRRFAGIIGISGWIAGLDGYPKAFGAAARQQQVLMTHGRFDPMLPIARVREQAEALRTLGIDLTWKDYAKEHSLDQQDEVRDIRDWMRARMAKV